MSPDGFKMSRRKKYMKEISIKDIVNPKDKNVVKRAMINPVKRALERKEFMAVLCLVCCFIDGILGDGSEERYKKKLPIFFPTLCNEIKPSIFYDKYRCGIVHNFAIRSGYGIAENHEINGKYVEEMRIKETGKTMIFLNIERLASDFIKMVDKL